MVSVASLLNPLPLLEDGVNRIEPRRISNIQSSRPAPRSPVPRTMKPPKPAAAFLKGGPRLDVNYPPCEYQDEIIAMEHSKYQVEPIGQITNTARHIPYHSDKKDFQQKTGRDGFQAFQYTFRMPDDDPHKEPHIIMWDYNVGLVRTTALFKSLKHSKTMPAKVLTANPGLRDITHSITGGAIAAQGYWMPFQAARAIAATFCYEIRYVLTPVFGPNFPELCIEPEDPAFMRPSIDPEIIDQCTQMANSYRVSSRESSVLTSPRSPTQRPRELHWTPRSTTSKGPDDDNDDRADRACSPLPTSSMRGQKSGWNPVNIPRSCARDQRPIPSPQGTREPNSVSYNHSHVACEGRRSAPKETKNTEQLRQSPVATSKRKRPSPEIPSPPDSTGIHSAAEILAIKALLELHRADSELGTRLKSHPRRSSA